MLPIVIVNPKSAGGSTRSNWYGIAADLRAHFGPFRSAFTKYPGHGIELAEKYARSNVPLIIACGGDGTINEVLNGIMLAGTQTALGIMPSGTGGDFRRTITMPAEPREASRALSNGRVRKIDVGRISYSDSSGKPKTRYFINVSSFGLAAGVIQRVKSDPLLEWFPFDKIRGRMSYALSTLLETTDLAANKVRVRIDGSAASVLSTVNFCIANARYFGGGMKIAPNARISDGLLDIVNIGDITALRILLNAYTLYSGSHLSLPEVKSRRAKEVFAEPIDNRIRFEADGEIVGNLPAKFEILPKAVNLIVPKK
ncbi:MAG TPA: diacylglycerol kinase family protein [Pyrinomonadaceae bacterium]|nr:diacylglycerol kinase family protein [Pyrinomonadaceae bacterium]